MEVFHNFSQESITVKDFDVKERVARDQLNSHSINKGKVSKVPLDSGEFKDQTSLEFTMEDVSLDLSRVSDSLKNIEVIDNNGSGISSYTNDSDNKKPKLVLDFLNSIDSGKSLITSGELEVQGDTQNSICSKLGKIKIKGPRRPKKCKLKRHPFEIGRCRLWAKANKDPVSSKRKASSQEKHEKIMLEVTEVQARCIVETAANMGFSLNVDGEEAVNIIKSQIEQ